MCFQHMVPGILVSFFAFEMTNFRNRWDYHPMGHICSSPASQQDQTLWQMCRALHSHSEGWVFNPQPFQLVRILAIWPNLPLLLCMCIFGQTSVQWTWFQWQPATFIFILDTPFLFSMFCPLFYHYHLKKLARHHRGSNSGSWIQSPMC